MSMASADDLNKGMSSAAPAPAPTYAWILRTRLNILPAILAGIGFAVLVYGISQLVNAQPPVPINLSGGPTGTTPPPDAAALQLQMKTLSNDLDGLTKSRDALKDRLDSISQQASHAQWLLSIVLGAAGLLTLAQGFFAFFSAQNYVKQAEDAIKRANDAEGAAKAASEKAVKEMEALAVDVRSRFPMFTNIESARADAFGELNRLTDVLERDQGPGGEGYQNLYVKSDPLIRQKIFAIENFSTIQFLTGANRNKELIENLRLLGRFYAGKYISDNPPLKSDFERSYYYFDLASQKSNRNYTVLNDLGWLFAIAQYPDRGRAFFEESMRSKPDQQRALYNLGTLEFEKGNRLKLERGRGYLLKAKNQTNWEESPNPDTASHVDYNIACFFDAIAATETDLALKADLLDKCAVYLELAAQRGAQPKELVEDDLRTGDLAQLGGSQPHATRLQTILATYQAAWSRNAAT
jgi:hypothetical protein